MKKLSLSDQCKNLSIGLDEIKLTYNDRPESALLKYYQNLGYNGSFTEGVAIFTIIKALMLDKLIEINSFSDENDACVRALEAQLLIHKEKIDEIIHSVRKVDKKKHLENLNKILNQPFIKNEYPSLNFEFCEAIINTIDKNILIAVFEKFSEDPYTYRNGWPDLTIVKGDDIRFIEVKTTDKLHKSQLITIPVFSKILPYSFSVCRVIKNAINF